MTPTPRIYPSTPRLWHVAIGAGQHMAVHLAGAADGERWLVLHGGPGSGGNPGLLQPFDLQRQRVAMPDQRGSGRSLPWGSTRRNSLALLVQDLETLRRQLGWSRWNVLGGSWGATLALSYAARHPEAVAQLVLRGTFDASPRTVRRLFQRFWPAPVARPARLGSRPMLQGLSQLFQSGTDAVTRRATLAHWQRMELEAAWHGARRARLALAHPQAQNATAPATRRNAQQRHWASLNRQRRRPNWPVGPVRQRSEHAWQAKFQIQAHLLARAGGLRPGSWTAQLARIAQAGIPTTWVQGRQDAVCPPASPWAAHLSLARRHPGSSQWRATTAGHLGHDPETARALRQVVQANPGAKP